MDRHTDSWAMSSPSYHTNSLCKYLVILGAVAVSSIYVFFNQTYTISESFYGNIFTIKCQKRLLQPKETATNLSHLMFVVVGSPRTWKKRRNYVESWWRPNVTRGNIFFDVEPSKELLPWSPTFPPFRVSENVKKLRFYPKLRKPSHTRFYRAILETYRLMDEGVRWYIYAIHINN